MEKKPLSRFSTQPVLNGEGKPVACKETPWLIRQLGVIARYPFLTAPYIAALSGADAQSVTQSFKIAKREPNMYVRIAEFQLRNPHLYLHSPLVYQLAHRGESLMRKHGIEANTGEWSGPPEHRLMSCKIRASFDIGLKERPDISLITWSTINDTGTVDPFIPTGLKNKATGKEIRKRADCYPFIVQNGEKRYRLLGIEADRDTESLNGKVRDAFLCYLNILKEGTYLDHLYFDPPAYIPFVTVSQIHMRNMMQLLHAMTAETPKLRAFFLFKVFKDEPTGWALTEPWQRVDNEPLTFV